MVVVGGVKEGVLTSLVSPACIAEQSRHAPLVGSPAPRDSASGVRRQRAAKEGVFASEKSVFAPEMGCVLL